ncbi:hypothetical protein ACWDSD_31680 [Streptomyces spiralis]
MRRNIGSAVPLAALALLTACGGHTQDICTLIYTPAGIRVAVHPGLASSVADATLTACWDGTCRKRTLQLGTWPEERATSGNPVMTTESATATEPPAARAPQHPESSLPRPGFVLIRGLQSGEPVQITLLFKNQQGATVLERQISTTTPPPAYSNGRNCSPDGSQIRLTVTREGTLIPR